MKSCIWRSFFLFGFLMIFIPNLSGQKYKNNYRLKKILSVEDYTQWDEIIPPYSTDIVGLFQFDNSSLFWITLNGNIIFYDVNNDKIVKHDGILDEDIITKSAFNQSTNKLYLCQKGKIISIYNVKNRQLEFDRILIDFSTQDSITINNFAVNPSGNYISTFSKNEIIYWQLNDKTWDKKTFKIDKEPFSVKFLNNSTLLIGSHDGYGQLVNLENQDLLKSIKMFKNEVFQ